MTVRHPNLAFPADLTGVCASLNDSLGCCRICSWSSKDMDLMCSSQLNRPVRCADEEIVYPSFIVRIWSRSSRKYLNVLNPGSLVYGRNSFGDIGQFRLIVLRDDVVILQSTSCSDNHIAIRNGIVIGNGEGGEDCEWFLRQNENGSCSFENIMFPSCYLGVRKNGNIIQKASNVDGDSIESSFVIQLAAMVVQ